MDKILNVCKRYKILSLILLILIFIIIIIYIESIILYINSNQGFFLCLLTFIYVVATLNIMLSNNKLTNIAIESNKQHVALQLLDRRLNSFSKLNDWISISTSLFKDNVNEFDIQKNYKIFLFDNPYDKELNSINSRLKSIELSIDDKTLSTTEHQKFVDEKKQLERDRFFQKMVLLDLERDTIMQIAILFPTIEFKPIKSFCDSFMDVYFHQTSSNFAQLKIHWEGVNIKTTRNLWEIMKDFNF